MKLVQYEICGMTSVGVVSNSGDIIDVQKAYEASLKFEGATETELYAIKGKFRNMIDLLEGGDAGLSAARKALAFGSNAEKAYTEKVIAPKDFIKILAPVTNPKKITCAGLNYADHVNEGGHSMPAAMALFSKYANSINNPGDPVVLPRVSNMVDWEGELAVVIGKRGKYIAEEEALDYIAGYTIFHDVSVRDYQMATSQYLAGKTFDGHAPMGPYLVLKDEIADPHQLNITTEVNGEVVQHANTRDMIFKIHNLISYMSQIWTLEPGDILSTGTMSGVGFRRNPQRFLKHGDVVRITIEGLGVLENPFYAEEVAVSPAANA